MANRERVFWQSRFTVCGARAEIFEVTDIPLLAELVKESYSMPDIQKALDGIARIRDKIEKTNAGVAKMRENARNNLPPEGVELVDKALQPITLIMDGLSVNLDRIEAALRSP